MSTINRNTPATVSTGTGTRPADNEQSGGAVTVQENGVGTAEGSYALDGDNRLNALVDVDEQGLRRAHLELEHFTEGGGRVSVKVGTSALSDETQGSVLAKLQYDTGKMPINDALSHSVTLKTGAFYIPNTFTRRHDIDESMTLIGVGGKYELQLDTALGSNDDVKLTGKYGVGGGLFIEPNPSERTKEIFTRGTNFGYFDIGKFTGFSELTVSAQTRAAYQVNDKVSASLTHKLEFEMDDFSIGRTINDHSLTGGVEVLSLFGRDQFSARGSLRVPLEDRTPRYGELPDTVESRLDFSYKPTPELDLNVHANARDFEFAGAGFEADYKLNERLSVAARYDYDAVRDEHKATVGLSFKFYTHKKRRTVADLERSNRRRNIQTPPDSHRVYAQNVQGFPDVKNMSYEEAMAAIDTPEKAAALLGNGTFFEYGFHEPGKMSARYSFDNPVGTVCAEQHAVQAAALRANGYDVHNVQFFGAGVAHVVTTYKDKETGKWNIMDYNQIIETQADNIRDAMNMYEPGNYEYKLIDYSDTSDKYDRPTVVGVQRANVVQEINAFWND